MPTRDFTDTQFHRQAMRQPFENRYYVDCDLRSEAARANRMTGMVPETHDPGTFCGIFEETFAQKIVPKGEWDAVYAEVQPNYSRRKSWQYDQNGEGTCTANATSGAYSYIMASTYGRKNAICPSPPTMYMYCARGPNTGSSTSCNLKRLRDHGCLPINHEKNKDILRRMGLDDSHVCDAVGWNKPRSCPSGWEETAKNFRLDEFYEITSVEGFFSALLHGFSILYGRSGHAIHGVDIVKRSGQWYCKYDNSWGRWGENGFGFDSESYIKRTGGYRWAYAFQSIVTPSGIDKLMEIPTLG